MITHRHSIDRFIAKKEQKLFAAEDKAMRSILRSDETENRRADDLDKVETFTRAVQNDAAQERLDAENAEWKKVCNDVYKSSYRLLPDSEKLSRMPKNKTEWKEFWRPKIPQVIQAMSSF